MWLLRKLFFPLSLVYAFVVYVRNRLFDAGVFKSKTYKTPIICVGNLSLGGTGKTPMVELLISLLQNTYKVAVLSRGYKRKSTGFLLATAKSTVEQLGDEPFQIHRKFSKVSVAVDADRRNGIDFLERNIKPDVILLDDAFQHRKVKPGLSILLTAYGKLYSDDWCLPSGTLRDNKREAKRADLIVVTKCTPSLTITEQASIVKRLKLIKGQQVLFSYLSYAQELKGQGRGLQLNNIKNKKVTLVTGIADPKPLVSFLTENRIDFEHLPFTDHHFFTATELNMLNSKEFILTTEKDYMRLGDGLSNCYYISISHKFIGDGHELLTGRLVEFMR